MYAWIIAAKLVTKKALTRGRTNQHFPLVTVNFRL